MAKPVTGTQYLRDAHKRIKGIFRQLEAVDARAHEMKAAVCRQMIMELEIHTEIEETVFYPAFAEATHEIGRALVDQYHRDHDEVDGQLREIKSVSTDDSRFNDLLEDLIASTEAHIEKEESEMLTLADDVLASRLVPLAEQMHGREAELRRMPVYRDAQPERVQNPNGGEQKRVA